MRHLEKKVETTSPYNLKVFKFKLFIPAEIFIVTIIKERTQHLKTFNENVAQSTKDK